MRRPLLAGNWKLHKTLAESLALAEELRQGLINVEGRDIAVAPVFTSLAAVARQLAGSNIAVAAQNCYPESTGAYTGEVSPPLLKDSGCSFVIVGHSERRTLFGESNEFINRKLRSVLAAGLQPILCVGETLEEREAGKMFDVLRRQVKQGLADCIPAQCPPVVLAYEPVWAIGTGKTATPDQAQEAHAFLRSLVAEQMGQEAADELRILYGGSVKPDNVDALMAQPDIDGSLVGGASLKAEDFIRIVRFRQE